MKRIFATIASVTSLMTLLACVGDDPSNSPATSNDGGGNADTGSSTDGASSTDGGGGGSDADAAPTCAGKTCKAGFACVDGHCGEEPRAVAMGVSFACALLWSGQVWCWGATDRQQVGSAPNIGTDGQCSTRTCRAPGLVPGVTNAVSISAGYEHACVVDKDGAVTCWGDNATGQLAQADTVANAGPSKVVFPGGVTIAQVSAGETSTCARSTAGAVYCWGTNAYEESGEPLVNGSVFRTPQLVAGLTALDISVSFDRNSHPHACAIDSTKKMVCWGSNFNNELGHGGSGGTPADDTCNGGYCNDVPNAIETLATTSPVTSLASAPATSCALHGGLVKCWGDARFLKLGATVGGDNSYAAVTVAGLPAATAADPIDRIEMRAASGFAITKSGDVWGWGLNNVGILALDPSGDVACPNAATCRPAQRLTAVPKVTALATGVDSTVAITTDGKVIAWGANSYATLGKVPADTDPKCGTTPCSIIPAVVPGLP